jgi:uncharacterized protein (TIGR03437 family)
LSDPGDSRFWAEFFDGATLLGTAPIANGSATFSVATLTPGAHRLSATYSGDPNWYMVRSQAVDVSISQAPTATTLNVTFTSAQTTLAAIVSGPNGTAVAGGVRFIDANTNTLLGVGEISGGSAAITLSPADTLSMAGHAVAATYSGNASIAASTSNTVALAAAINAAGQLSANFASDELVTIFGSHFASDMGVTVTDAAGTARPGSVAYIAPGQINFVMPAGLAMGPATITLARGGTVVYALQSTIASVAPGLFTVSGDGRGTVSAQIIRVRADGTRSLETAASPIVMGGDTLYLVLYGTGIRNRSAESNVACAINGTNLPVTYAGPQTEFAGLDQVDVLLPASFRGLGSVSLTLLVDGQRSNTATIMFR